jgi:predicted alpha/beta hydrolase family esterase
MGTRGFLILHGVENRRPSAHWQHHLADALSFRGEDVGYPQLPDPDEPSLDAWIDAIEDELVTMDGERVVVCHSLACAAWFHLVAGRTGSAAHRVLLVSPPGPSVFSWDAIAEFSPEPLTLTGLELASRQTRLVGSDNDPYCREGAAEAYGRRLGCAVDLLPGAGHVTPADGYGLWQSVFDWCLDPAVRLTTNA